MYAEIVDICTRAEIQSRDVARLRKLCIQFFEHFERFYMKYRRDRVDFCKSVFHILLHLSDCLEHFGPLIGVSQYWLEGYIGWVCHRNNPKTKPDKSMLKNALLGESLKLFYGRGVYEKHNIYDERLANEHCVFLGPFKLMKVSSNRDWGRSFRKFLESYFRRKYESLSEEEAKSVSRSVTSCQFAARACFSLGCETQTARAHLSVKGENSTSPKFRQSCFIAAEMEDTPGIVEVWYGRLLRLMTFDLSLFGERNAWAKKHDIAIIEWAEKLEKGSQGQVYFRGRTGNAFARPTAEDTTIMKRLIKVVEHQVACERMAKNRSRLSTRTYFLDDCVRSNNLLSSNHVSTDGVNRILRGFLPRQR